MPEDARHLPTLDVIAYRLAEIQRTVELGFQRLDTRLDRHDERLAKLEQFQAVSAASDLMRSDADRREDLWPLVFKILAAMVALGVALAGGTAL